ncbi:uncharacterized protein PHACADRAFT_258211 [Phanerochaete carnosa HHB-10118-sp]|uniref:F-box domain-containing protein n=1 Tax=Phanerochaete carnosa (strain HHB-10118-sp) TaxID=650164 RepID=K5W5J3_PHACS|nr:uncharacterized protein PHACADRAFT_258211 [Phanerochaete carnosa HHB-10118-sp]EKM54395.1 hypothetical protein PHACADRAFT_258211 [Phanerochaete carnosa HHB-10118-sp]
MDFAPSVFAKLPNEVLHEVFGHAAAQDMHAAIALTLVASWVRHLVEPVLYNTVVLSSARSVHSFLDALSHKPENFGNENVKHLGIFAQGPTDAIDKVLDACRAVDSLACGFPLLGHPNPYGTHTVQTLECPKEQHLLGMATRDGWDIGMVGPTVTHLRVYLGTPKRLTVPQGELIDAASLDSLSYHPSLTHLALVYKPTKTRPITSLVPALKRLVSPSDGSASPDVPQRPKLALALVQVLGTQAAQASAVDALNQAVLAEGGDALRIVAERAPSSAACQWEDSVRGGKSVWDKAEEVVHHRLAAVQRTAC